jgi:membrane protease YdiL (CAAX protease family)
MTTCSSPGISLRQPSLCIFLGVLLLGWLPYAATAIGLRRVTSGWPYQVSWAVSDLLPVLLALGGIVAYEKRRCATTWGAALRSLGFGKPTSRAIWFGCLAGVPAVVGFGVSFLGATSDWTPHPHFVLVAIRIILAQAVLEELLFRGVAFGRLRQHLSVGKAASLAAAAFGLCHLANFMHRGFSEQAVVEIGVQVVMTFLLAFAPSFLVAQSSGLIWGACIWHLLIDLSILFPKLTPDFGAAVPGLVATLLTIPTAWIIFRLYREPPSRSANG